MLVFISLRTTCHFPQLLCINLNTKGSVSFCDIFEPRRRIRNLSYEKTWVSLRQVYLCVWCPKERLCLLKTIFLETVSIWWNWICYMLWQRHTLQLNHLLKAYIDVSWSKNFKRTKCYTTCVTHCKVSSE